MRFESEAHGVRMDAVDLDQLRLLSPAAATALSPVVTTAAVPLFTLLNETFPPGRQDLAQDVLDHLVVRLLDETRPGGALDPRQLGSDIPWATLIARLLDVRPVQARQTSVAWVRHLDHLALMEDDLVGHAVVAAVAAYSVAAAEEALGRLVQARRWSREADALVEQEPAGVSLAAYVRACSLLGQEPGQPRGSGTSRLPFSGTPRSGEGRIQQAHGHGSWRWWKRKNDPPPAFCMSSAGIESQNFCRPGLCAGLRCRSTRSPHRRWNPSPAP